MNVTEIFASIDGEGVKAGELATFVRIAGCNLRCSYCDTEYSLEARSGKPMSVSEIVNAVELIGYKNVTLTGGEPLIHAEVKALIDELTSKGYEVNIETNGSVDVVPFQSEKTIITADYKVPSSGYSGFMYMPNLGNLRENDVLKIVMAEEDMDFVFDLLKTRETKCWVYLSPIFGKIEPSRLVDFLKKCHENDICKDRMKVQLQMHKYIWNPAQRGV